MVGVRSLPSKSGRSFDGEEQSEGLEERRDYSYFPPKGIGLKAYHTSKLHPRIYRPLSQVLRNRTTID